MSKYTIEMTDIHFPQTISLEFDTAADALFYISDVVEHYQHHSEVPVPLTSQPEFYAMFWNLHIGPKVGTFYVVRKSDTNN